MKRTLIPLLAVLTLAACGQQESPPAATQADPAAPAPVAAVLKSGEDVYKQVCLSCHAFGVAGAPKSGEPGGWAALADEGQAAVTAHGWVGIRGMPPKGGRADLSLEEFARATAWMARSAGLDWADPDAAMLEAIQKEEALRREALKKG
ncbi:MAG: c-type cytochrome [Gammaproteobacteria bacterium]